MGRTEFGNRNVGSVKAAISLFGEKVLEGSPAVENRQMNFTEGSSSRAKELLKARTDLNRYEESKRNADSMKAVAETELLEARKTVKTLRSMIEELNSKVKSQAQNFERLKRQPRHEGRSIPSKNREDYQYEEVMRELEFVKQELIKLKLDVATVMEEKSRAGKEAEASRLKIGSYWSSVEALTKQIEEVSEEQVLVELASIEALKEHGAIEAQREKEEREHLNVMEEIRTKIKEASEEIEDSKELEDKLAVTLSDIEVLEVGLKLAKEMEKRVERKEEEKGDDSSPLLGSVVAELGAAKRELASIKEESFKIMGSMDMVRDELRCLIEEQMRLKKNEDKIDVTVQNLNSKILRARAKLETATKSEDKTGSIATNLSVTLERLKTESEAAKKEKELIDEEIKTAKEEAEKTENEVELREERLLVAMRDLEAAKLSETSALEKLKALSEKMMRQRALASHNGPWITVSRFEYDYLQGRATGAEEIADKRVEAAQAWIAALQASEKEILMKSEIVRREVTEMRVEEEHQVFKTERSLSAKRKVEGDLTTWHADEIDLNSGNKNGNPQLALQRNPSRKSSVELGPYASPARRLKGRKSASPLIRQGGRSGSITLKRRAKVMPNLSKLFSGRKPDGEE